VEYSSKENFFIFSLSEDMDKKPPVDQQRVSKKPPIAGWQDLLRLLPPGEKELSFDWSIWETLSESPSYCYLGERNGVSGKYC
jgi:hypothetical protein